MDLYKANRRVSILGRLVKEQSIPTTLNLTYMRWATNEAQSHSHPHNSLLHGLDLSSAETTKYVVSLREKFSKTTNENDPINFSLIYTIYVGNTHGTTKA
ncbi:MAG: hypothetical protein ACRCZZ_09015 [Phocaeicola sp.]